MLLITNATALIKGKFHNNTDILINNEGYIDKVAPTGEISTNNCEIYDIKGAYCAAGYIDIHTHGGGGHDLMEGTIEAIEAISAYHLSTGTTSYCPTTLTAPLPDTLKAIELLRKYKSTDTARRLGAHLEGPYISLKAPGAHPPKYILNPNAANTEWVWNNSDIVARITLAPDSDGARYMAIESAKHKIQVSLGHDASIDDEIYALISEGASSITHMTNCTSRPSRRTTPHKHLGLTEVGMISNKLVCEIIADDRHVPNDMVKLLIRTKGVNKIALVSDSLSVAGMGEGEFFLGSGDSRQRLLVDNGVATLPDLNTYAGSITPIAKMVVNCVTNINIPLNKAIIMGNLVPAKLLKLKDRGDISKGMLGDINVLNSKGEILNTVFNGKIIK